MKNIFHRFQQAQAALRQRRVLVYGTALLLVTVPAIGMYLTAQSQANGWTYALVGLVVAGNFLIVST